MWVRGLKLIVVLLPYPGLQSHPMWVRGLKLWYLSKIVGSKGVAPHVGAWIETNSWR